jgi:hypothetical protein
MGLTKSTSIIVYLTVICEASIPVVNDKQRKIFVKINVFSFYTASMIEKASQQLKQSKRFILARIKGGGIA